MRAHYPFGLVAGDMSNDGVRIHSSSGTTGNPTVIVHSQHDLDSWANLVARCLYAVGTVSYTHLLPDEIENKIEADINYSLWPN